MIKKIMVCSTAEQSHALAVLRLIGPLEQAEIDLLWHMPGDKYTAEMLSGCDLLVIQRDFPRNIEEYIQIHLDAHQLHIPVVFEIDDLLWELPEYHPDRLSCYYTQALLPMMFAAWAADGITVSSPGIKQYLSFLNTNIAVLPNYLNTKLWYFQNPGSRPHETISIGYMGGDSHLPDLLIVEPVILNLLDRYQGRVKFITWGIKPPHTLRGHPNVEWQPLSPGNYSSFAAYFNQQVFDIYIAPLDDSLFNRCKSSVKYLEYTALGIPGVCSDLEPYTSIVDPGVSGLLADSAEQWEKQLETLINDVPTRLNIASKSQEAVRKHWLLSNHYQEWTQAYTEFQQTYQPHSQTPEKLHMLASISEQFTTQMKHKDAELMKQIQINQNLQAELSQIKQSRSWKVAQTLRSMYSALYPSAVTKPGQETHDKP